MTALAKICDKNYYSQNSLDKVEISMVRCLEISSFPGIIIEIIKFSLIILIEIIVHFNSSIITFTTVWAFWIFRFSWFNVISAEKNKSHNIIKMERKV